MNYVYNQSSALASYFCSIMNNYPDHNYNFQEQLSWAKSTIYIQRVTNGHGKCNVHVSHIRLISLLYMQFSELSSSCLLQMAIIGTEKKRILIICMDSIFLVNELSFFSVHRFSIFFMPLSRTKFREIEWECDTAQRIQIAQGFIY